MRALVAQSRRGGAAVCEGQALMVELGAFSSLREAPMPPGVDVKAIKTWYPDDAEIETIFKPWTDDWNKAYNYRQ